MKPQYDELTEFIQKKGGYARTAELIKAGFYKVTIYAAMKEGHITRLKHGLYGLVDIPDISHPDLVTASLAIPKGVICLIAALFFYEVTDEIPRYIDMAVPAGWQVKPIEIMAIRIYHFSLPTWEACVEIHKLGQHEIKIYCLAKTIADCFKFRNQIGVDVARSALKNAFEQKKVSHQEIMKYAKICRVTNVIKPILETLL